MHNGRLRVEERLLVRVWVSLCRKSCCGCGSKYVHKVGEVVWYVGERTTSGRLSKNCKHAVRLPFTNPTAQDQGWHSRFGHD